MSKKRTSGDSDNDRGGAPPPSTSDDAKRAKLVSLSDTTLQDLPIELLKSILVKAIAMEVMHMKVVKTERKENAALVIGRLSNVCFQWSNILSTSTFQTQLNRILDVPQLEDLPIELFECILVKAVTTEVWELKLAKSVWKVKADGVLNRLGTVCPHWNSILTSGLFMNELHRQLDRTPQKPVRFEILHQYPIPLNVSHIAELRNEIYIGHGVGYIAVYDRDDMRTKKQQINLKVAWPRSMVANEVSNCVLLLYKPKVDCIEIHKIEKDAEHNYQISTLVESTWLPDCVPSLTVAENGCIVLHQTRNFMPVLVIFSVTGSLLKTFTMTFPVPKFARHVLVRKAENLLLVSLTSDVRPTVSITETDMDGIIQRQRNSLDPGSIACYTDSYGRVLMSDHKGNDHFMDGELNDLELCRPLHGEYKDIVPRILCCDGERNEVMTFGQDKLTIFRFIED